MKNQLAITIPLIVTGIVPTAAVTSALLSPPAMGATGDLDPGFGDVGRLGPILNGPAWSLQPLDDDSMLLGGGGAQYYYYYWYYEYLDTTHFVSHVSGTGSLDATYTPVANAQVFDIVRQTDGQIVAVGRIAPAALTDTQLTVFRLQSNGLLDTTFADAGTFTLPTAGQGNRHTATSVVLDPDGRIVVAGSRDDQVMVLRLLPDGTIDDTFGSSGVFAGPDTHDYSTDGSGPRTGILRTADGGYRVTASSPAGCQIVALTADGEIDPSFGTAGIVTVDAPAGASTYCDALASQDDGRLLVAGSVDGQAFAARILADGQADPDFSADTVTDAMHDATAVAAGKDGTIVVAGTGVSGASIMRLQANGELDGLFGNSGTTLIDLPSATGTSPVVRDMVVQADGSVLAAGGEQLSNRAFVVKLLGVAGGDSPGVLGMTEQAVIPVTEDAAEVVVNVRRTGGASGTVSLAYQTAGTGFSAATGGQDYVDVAGRLTWADGDTSEQQIRATILTDDAIEEAESFVVTLSDLQGGAGLGTASATVEIAADGSPYGQFAIAYTEWWTNEDGPAYVGVLRNYYFSGPVSVTLTPVSGTATAGQDFVATPVTLSWADGEAGWKDAAIPIINDSSVEQVESFTVQLSNPTGGAVIGPHASATVTIEIDQERSTAASGGGALGYWSLLLLGTMKILRWLCAAVGFGAAPRVRRSG